MKTETGSLKSSERLHLKVNQETRLCNSILTSMNSLGYAPVGEFTTLIGPKGNGKSAFIKTFLNEAAFQNVKTLIILSEEKVLKYKQPICEMFYKSKMSDKADDLLNNLFFTTMLDWNEKFHNVKSFLSFIENEIHKNKIQLVIFDNFTTSFLGRLSINEQGYAVEKIRELTNYYEISFLGVFHTAKGVNIYSKLIDGEDVRGNATSTNLAAYNYTITTFFRCNPPRSFLHIDKARYHSEMNKTYWELKFDPKIGIFTKDRKSSAAQIEAIMAEIKKQTRGASTKGF